MSSSSSSSLLFDPWSHDELLFHPSMFFDWDPARPAQRSMFGSGGGLGSGIGGLGGGGSMLPLSGLTTSLADPGNISNVGSRRYPNTLWLDVFDRGDSFVIEADVPGVGISDSLYFLLYVAWRRYVCVADAKDVDLKLDQSGTILNINATRRLPEQRKGDEWRRHERDYGKFRRTVKMPATAAADQASAKVEFGVLKIVVPKKASGRVEGGERERSGQAQAQVQSKSERERERERERAPERERERERGRERESELERARADEIGRRPAPATATATDTGTRTGSRTKATGTVSDTGYERERTRERERGRDEHQWHAAPPPPREPERERGRWSTMEESEMDAPSAGAKHGDKRSWDEPSLTGSTSTSTGATAKRDRDQHAARHWEQPSQASASSLSSSSSRGGVADVERDTLSKSKGYAQSSRDRDRDRERWERDQDRDEREQEHERERERGREPAHTGSGSGTAVVSPGGASIPISSLRVSQPQSQQARSMYAY